MNATELFGRLLHGRSPKAYFSEQKPQKLRRNQIPLSCVHVQDSAAQAGRDVQEPPFCLPREHTRALGVRLAYARRVVPPESVGSQTPSRDHSSGDSASRNGASRIRVAIVAPSLGILGGQAVQADRLLRGWESDPDVDAWLVPVNPLPPRPLRAAVRVK